MLNVMLTYIGLLETPCMPKTIVRALSSILVLLLILLPLSAQQQTSQNGRPGVGYQADYAIASQRRTNSSDPANRGRTPAKDRKARA